MKRLASCSNDLKDMASDMESNTNHGMQPVTNEAANRTLKLRKSDGNENFQRQMHEYFPQDDHHRLTDKDIQCSATSRWKSAVAKTLTGGGSKKSSMPVSSSFGSVSSPDIKCVTSGKQLILESPAKLVVGVHSRDRYLFLSNDVLIIAKGRPDSNFRLKNKVLTSSLWVTSCSEKALVIGWPMQNSTFAFESSCLRDQWLTSLKDAIKAEKSKEVLQSIQIKIIRKDCEYTATKSLLVSNHETSSRVVERCLEEFHILDAAVSDFQLCVASTEDDTTFVLSGHEYPFTIWTNSSQISAESSSEAKIQFVLRSNKKTNQRQIGENAKSISRGRVLKRLFKRSSVHKGNVKLFGRELSELFEQDASIPYPIMQILRKLYVDGPHTDGVFRKSANHTKLTALKQSLNCGEFVNFDEVPVHLAAVLLKEFLRSLPNCLLNCQLYHEWMSVALIQNYEEQIASIRRLVFMLPSCNQTLLRHLVCVLCNLAKHSEECKMDAYNLAICVGQSILWPGTSVVQKVDANNANVIVQQMIDFATDILGPGCLTLLSNAVVVRRPAQILLRGISADFDSQLDTGAATVSMRSSLGLEFTRSCSQTDYSPIVPDKDDFKMQSSQSCDSGLQLGEVLECQDMLSASEMHMSANFKYFTASESREEEEDCKHVVPKKLRQSRGIPEVLLSQQNSSLDTNSSLQSDDSVCDHSVESPLSESVDLRHDQSSLSYSSTLPSKLGKKSSDFSNVVGTSSKRMQFFQSMLQPPAPSFDMSLGQSINMFFTCDKKSIMSQKKFSTNDSGVSFLGSFDKNYEESSDMECGRDVGGSVSLSQSIKSPATDDSLENFSSTPFSCTRGGQSDQTRHRRPTLSELPDTSFSEKCLEMPEQLKEGNMLERAKRNESTLSNSSAFVVEGSSSVSGNCNLDKVFHSAHRTKQNPTYPPSSEHFWPVARMNKIAKESENRQLDSLPRRPLLRSNAFESDPENVKQGAKTAGSGHFPPQVKGVLHQSNPFDKKVFKSHSSKDSAAENLSSMTTRNTTCIRREAATQNSSVGFSAHKEMALVKLRRDKPNEQHSSSTVRNLPEEGLRIRQFIPHCKSLENVSLKADSKNAIFLAQNRSPSYGSILANETQTRDRVVQVLAEMNYLELSKCKDIRNNIPKARRPLSLDNKIDKTPAIACRSKQFSELRSYYDRCHEKTGDSLKSCNAVISKSFSSSDYSIRPRLTRKHSRPRFIRKRNSDPRLNVEGKRGSDLERSKSDASEHCRNSKLMMHQFCSRRKSEVECSKENFTSLENILLQKKIERCGKAMSAKDLSMRNVNHHTEIVKRKSVTIKDRDWHKELARQYIKSASPSINISSSRKSGSSSTTYRFGREIEKSVNKSVIDSHKRTGEGDLVPSNSSKSSTIGGNFLNYRLTGDRFDDGCKNTADQKSKSLQNTGSISCSLTSTAVKSCISTASETSHLPGVKLSNTSVRELRENFRGLPSNSDASKISDNCSKTCAASLVDSSDSLINKDFGRPLEETDSRMLDDSKKILDPANISWSVARLKELYSNQDKQSGDRKIRTSYSESEDRHLSKKSSTLPRIPRLS